jgi:hypothetical protein
MVRKNCGRCHELLSANGEYVTCSGCQSDMHYNCSGLKESTYRGMSGQKKLEWRCQTCRGSKNRSNSQSSLDPDNTDMAEMIKQINTKLQLLTTIDIKLEDMKSRISEINLELKTYKDKVVVLEEKIEQKDKKINILEDKILQLEQYNRLKNVEITGLKEDRNEDLKEIFGTICKKMKTQKVTTEDIDIIHRIPTMKKGMANPIIIQFKTRTARNSFISLKKTQIKSRDIIPQGDESQIRIRENYSKDFKRRFWEIKQEANRRNYKYVWSRNGNIFIRMAENENSIKINSMEDFNNL